jgi:hypothetical protein
VWAITAIVVAGVAALAFGKAGEGAPVVEPYATGDRLALAGVVDKAERTAVIVLSTTCYYCGTSAGFVHDLAEESTRAPSFRVVLVSAESVNVVQRFASRHRIHPAEIASLPRDRLRVASVPTFLVANEDGVIERIWTGEQPPAARALILASLRGGGS